MSLLFEIQQENYLISFFFSKFISKKYSNFLYLKFSNGKKLRYKNVWNLRLNFDNLALLELFYEEFSSFVICQM